MSVPRTSGELADVRGASWMAVLGLAAFLALILAVRVFEVLPFRAGPVCAVMIAALLLNIGLAVLGRDWVPSRLGVLAYEAGHAVAYTVVLHFVGALQDGFGFAFIVYAFLVIHSVILHRGAPAFLTANICACCYALLVGWEAQRWRGIPWAFLPGDRIVLVAFGFLSLNYLALFVKRYGRQLREFALRLEGTVADLRASNRALELANCRAERSEEYFRTLIEQGSDLVWILSGEGYIRYASPSHARVLGYAPEELVGRRAGDFVHRDDHREARRVFQYIVRNPETVVRGEFRFRHRNGSWRCLESIARSRLQDPVVAGAVVNLRDVTERKEAEQQLAAYAAELEKRRQEIGAFIYTVTHDLKNPVNAILLTADLTLERESGALSEVGREHLRRIIHLADGADKMVRDLLGLVKITSGREEPTWVDLGAVVAQSLEGFGPQIAAKGVRVNVGALPLVWGQPAKLAHVVDNLLSNAIKYVPAGSGEVELSSRRENGAIVMCVRDNGVGIPRAYHQRIFKIFGRVPPDEQRVDDQAAMGTGVGLSIVKHIVERHGGSVSVDSEPGKGSRFYLRLPMGPGGPRDSAAAVIRPSRPVRVPRSSACQEQP
jgi:PAS domain S-box-containing protein